MQRPRFTIRAVFAVTAISALALRQSCIVQRRKAAMRGVQPVTFVLAVRQPGDATEPPKLNPLRELFGDRPVRYIDIVAVAGASETQDRLSKLFPEATIRIVQPEQPAPCNTTHIMSNL